MSVTLPQAKVLKNKFGVITFINFKKYEIFENFSGCVVVFHCNELPCPVTSLCLV